MVGGHIALDFFHVEFLAIGTEFAGIGFHIVAHDGKVEWCACGGKGCIVGLGVVEGEDISGFDGLEGKGIAGVGGTGVNLFERDLGAIEFPRYIAAAYSPIIVIVKTKGFVGNFVDFPSVMPTSCAR